MNILTEEELNRHEDTLPQLVQSVSIAGCIVEIIESHRNLLSANAELSFKNQKGKADIKEYFQKLYEQMPNSHAAQSADTVQIVLDMLGIKIEGVNA